MRQTGYCDFFWRGLERGSFFFGGGEGVLWKMVFIVCGREAMANYSSVFGTSSSSSLVERKCFVFCFRHK